MPAPDSMPHQHHSFRVRYPAVLFLMGCFLVGNAQADWLALGRNENFRAYLDQAQAAWAVYSDLVCKGVYDKWNGGSIRNVAALRCRIDMTRERTQVVWRDYLTYVDSTPPELPEPIRPASEELSYED